ncbi:hypothetical protein [Permianibacter fluminis]|uniref:hypothetical protein n=1 Tax=Permianibacter fluminis TaxID=2738515 RepID=UPI001B7D784C
MRQRRCPFNYRHLRARDRAFDEANEVELIDLPPDELLPRLEGGNVYLLEQAERAAQHYFRKGRQKRGIALSAGLAPMLGAA